MVFEVFDLLFECIWEECLKFFNLFFFFIFDRSVFKLVIVLVDLVLI